MAGRLCFNFPSGFKVNAAVALAFGVSLLINRSYTHSSVHSLLSVYVLVSSLFRCFMFSSAIQQHPDYRYSSSTCLRLAEILGHQFHHCLSILSYIIYVYKHIVRGIGGKGRGSGPLECV